MYGTIQDSGQGMTGNTFGISLLSREYPVTRRRLYTPTQVTLGALWGGPIAAAYFIRQNFQALKKGPEAGLTQLLGALATVIFLLTLSFLPERFPSLLIPLVYTAITWGIVMRWQPGKETIANDTQYDFQSNWRVFFTGLVTQVLTVLLATATMLALSALGLLDLR